MSAAPLTWDGGRLDGTSWQGIRRLSIEFHEGTDHPAVLTVHLNQPSGSLTPRDIEVAGLREIPTEVEIEERRVVITFGALGGPSPYTVTLKQGGGSPLHPFFASAQFRFTIDCESGDCRELPQGARRAIPPAPAVDLLTKDFNGFVRLLGDWVKVHNPQIADLSPASFERVLLDLIAWFGDMTSYYQDRVANEAFVQTAVQRFSLRQHAVLLGTKLDDGTAPTTVLAFDVGNSGFVPAGLQVRTRTAAAEVPVIFTVARRTRVHSANRTSALRIAAFPGAPTAQLPLGATSALLWGHGPELSSGDRLAFVQGSFSQVVTLAAQPRRFTSAGWVEDPSDSFDPAVDPPAEVTELRWREPLAKALTPWSGEPLEIRANLVDAIYGAPRRATVDVTSPPGRTEIPVHLTRETSIVTRGVGGNPILRALRLPEWPVVHDGNGKGAGAPAVEVTMSGEPWTRVEHLHASRSYDLHYTAEADEDGSVWLRFGDGTRGREVPLATPDRPVQDIELNYRIGHPPAGNVGLGTLVEIVPPATGTDEQAAYEALGTVRVTNVRPATGGRPPRSVLETREDLPTSLRHGPAQRAVALDDYAAAAMQLPGVGRAIARSMGGVFNTVMVLVDPEGSEDLREELQRQVHDHLDGLRMAGREHVVVAAEYVPLDVELFLCVRPGFARHRVRDTVLAELRPGTNQRPGWFHPDRLSFGDVVRLGDLLAFVQGIAGVLSVRANIFRPLGDLSGPAVRPVIVLGRTRVARLDADPGRPEHGRLEVRIADEDAAPAMPMARPRWRISAVSKRLGGAPQSRIVAVGGVHPDGTRWRMTVDEVIAAIERGQVFFVEEPVGDRVRVVVSRTAGGRRYIRTESDGDEPNNLLALPPLPEDRGYRGRS